MTRTTKDTKKNEKIEGPDLRGLRVLRGEEQIWITRCSRRPFREEVSGRLAGLDQKIDRNFRRITGINVALWSTILVAILFRT